MLKIFIPLFFILLWILPVAWVGLMRSNYPLYPAWIAPLFRVSGIFESAPTRWHIFFIEFQDDRGWHYVDERALFASTPLGDRTRFQPLMNEIENYKLSTQVPNLLRWITLHLSQTNRLPSDVKAVRVVQYRVPSEAFLKSGSLSEVYKLANETKMSRTIVGSLNVNPSSDENP